jgi:hypothetical protein
LEQKKLKTAGINRLRSCINNNPVNINHKMFVVSLIWK